MPDQDFVNDRKRELLELARELTEQLSHDKDAERPGIDSAVGRLTFIDAHQQHQMALNAQRRSVAQLASVRAALKRIEEGTYGICHRCGLEILPERLEYLPETPYCTACNAK